MTLNRLAKEGRARRAGHVWFPVQGLQMEDDGAISFKGSSLGLVTAKSPFC